MAPQKCNYIVFSNDSKKQHQNLSIKLFNSNFTLNENPTFPGIRFDPSLSFKNQIKYLSETCHKRLCCIKILSNKCYKLSHQILIHIYTALVRSIMDYSSIIFPRITIARYKKLRSIQNSALRSIFHLAFDTPTLEIERMSCVPVLSDRFNQLNERYLSNCLINENPLIQQLYQEYLCFENSRDLKIKTLFCDYKNYLKNYSVLV